jgi:hypothetical protein
LQRGNLDFSKRYERQDCFAAPAKTSKKHFQLPGKALLQVQSTSENEPKQECRASLGRLHDGITGPFPARSFTLTNTPKTTYYYAFPAKRRSVARLEEGGPREG